MRRQTVMWADPHTFSTQEARGEGTPPSSPAGHWSRVMGGGFSGKARVWPLNVDCSYGVGAAPPAGQDGKDTEERRVAGAT